VGMNCQTKRLFGAVALLIALGQIAFAQSPSISAQQYSEQGQRALIAGNYKAAELAYKKLRDLEPGTAEVHANLGLIYFREGLPEQAVASLRKAIALRPSLKTARVLLALSLAELGQNREALPGLESAFHDPGNSDLRRMCGLELMRAYDNLRRESDAIEVGIALSHQYPNDPEILYQTGRVYGNFAFVTMQRLSEIAPHSIWGQMAAGEADESSGAFEQALTAYRAVLAMDPQHPGIHYRIGRTLEARSQQSDSADDIQAALKEFEQELQADPQNANASYEIGAIYKKAGQFAKAREFFEEAIKYHPDFEEAQLGMGGVLVDLGKPDLAIPHLKLAASLDPEDEVPYYRLARAFKALGNSAEAREPLEHFQRLHAKHEFLTARKSTGDDVTRQTAESSSPE
jgi:tetratricopeptide (TPR) repeat protein